MSATARLRILLLSGYDAASHRLWHENLARMMPEHEWTPLALAPRNFSWRLRGNALSFAFGERETLSRPYDLLIATSMVDLSTLRGFMPALAAIPTLLYFHENQFAYPTRDQQRANAEIQLVPLYAALCADSVAFNSEYNRRTFLSGAKELLRRLPDYVPKGLLQRLEQSHVVPVPVFQPEELSPRCSNHSTLEIVWNHRWEYDKGPERLLEVVKLLCAQRLNCRLHIVGQQFKQQPEEFDECRRLLHAHCISLNLEDAHFGFIESATDYHTLIHSCDVALSTALHDFQGLAMQEAAIAGCCPLAPADLVYPEYLPPENLYSVTQDNTHTARNVFEKLKRWQEDKNEGVALPRVSLTQFFEENLTARYQQLFARTIHSKQRPAL